ncbi:MAG: hypothetical protein ABW157_03695 [Candidatus Thiodiazotropha sp. LLP2]
MKIAAFALLLSGVFTTTMAPFASAEAGGSYAPGQYQGYWSAYGGASNYLPNQRVGQSQTASGWSASGMPPNYRFRPLSGKRQPAWRAGMNPVWRQQPTVAYHPAAQTRPAGYARSPQMRSPQNYRFRPISQSGQQPELSPPQVAYRPTNINIPAHYVYRPLNPVKKVQRHSYPRNYPPTYRPAPAYGFTPYMPMRSAPAFPYHATPKARSLPGPRYAYGRQPYPDFRFRPTDRAYGPPVYPAASYSLNRVPGYAPRWADRPKFRPSPRFQPPIPAYVDPFYAHSPGYAYPAMANTWPRERWGRYRPSYPQPNPSWQGTPDTSNGIANSRVDWYDGRADGEGAWYKLTQQQDWPRVSHNWIEENYHYPRPSE